MIPPGGEWLTLPRARPFFESLVRLGDEGAWSPRAMITLIAGECDLILMERPNAHGYQGLTQIGSSELRSLGWDQATRGAFCKAAPEVQIEYTARYFAAKRKLFGFERWRSAGHLWAANLAPAHLARVDGVVYGELESGPQYRANRWLDLDHDGLITCDELTTALETVSVPRCRARYDLALASLAEVLGESAQPPREYVENVQPAAIVERLRA